MKLRIKGNSVRFRLGQSEVVRLAQEGILEESTQLGPGERLTYALKISAVDTGLAASFSEGRLVVTVPAQSIAQWTATDQVGINDVYMFGEDELKVLIEKDFECLNPSAGEPQIDAFPHPLAGTACIVDGVP
jgi:hypothetical protein